MRKKRRFFKIFIPVLFCAVFVYLYKCSTNMIIEYGKFVYTDNMTTAAYMSIDECLSDELNYNDIIFIDKNADGDVVMVVTNAYKINKIATSLATEYKKEYSRLAKNGVNIPIGAFSGIKFLDAYGKKVNIDILSLYSVKVDIILQFSEAGINQTRQQLYAEVSPEVHIQAGSKSHICKNRTKIILFDTLIIGKVPKAYSGCNRLGSAKC